MATISLINSSTLFLDTSYLIALISHKDFYHHRALSLSNQIQNDGLKIICTEAIILEFCNALSKVKYRKDAALLVESLYSDESVTIIPLNTDLVGKGFELYKKRYDKDWGLVDCISFVTMFEYDLKEALTADIHFEQAGFKSLLRQ